MDVNVRADAVGNAILPRTFTVAQTVSLRLVAIRTTAMKDAN